MNSNVYPLKNTNSHYLLLNNTIMPQCNGKISLMFCEGDIASKLFERSPLGSIIVRNADALNPKDIADLEAHLLERKINQIL